MKVTGKAMVHGIEGVELTAREATDVSKIPYLLSESSFSVISSIGISNRVAFLRN